MVENEVARLGVDARWIGSRPDRVGDLVLLLVGVVDVDVKA